ncbi:hypothetical protein B0H17DRAFT_1155341 [Mycena rosella]|uniref:Uncharacterized protein n=1 Tax=Mycena rosella TaxID=1033263 RepID=A0AAD7F5A8_MYCRO|nr:hypothetical protein B0H17DRAFT_1155341 [Mycena rosella]
MLGIQNRSQGLVESTHAARGKCLKAEFTPTLNSDIAHQRAPSDHNHAQTSSTGTYGFKPQLILVPDPRNPYSESVLPPFLYSEHCTVRAAPSPLFSCHVDDMSPIVLRIKISATILDGHSPVEGYAPHICNLCYVDGSLWGYGIWPGNHNASADTV